MTIAIAAHAKLNLNLQVLGRRADGLHEISSLFQAISLHDLLIAERTPLTELEGGQPDDLVLRAQRALELAVGRKLPARIRLVKRIPVGAGLGGGSSDAAAALRALSRLYGLDEDLRPIAGRLGADVPFFLLGGTVAASGTGDRLVAMPQPSGCYAVAWPGFSVSTAEVYSAWDRLGGEGDNHLSRAATAVEPRLEEFVRRLPGWRMTGSGTAFFKPCQDVAEAERAIRSLGCWTAVARPVPAWGTAA